MFDLIVLAALAVFGIGGVALLALAVLYSRDEIGDAEQASASPTFDEVIRDHLALKKRNALRPGRLAPDLPAALPGSPRRSNERRSRRPTPPAAHPSRRRSSATGSGTPRSA